MHLLMHFAHVKGSVQTSTMLFPPNTPLRPCSWYNFKGSDQSKKVGSLSGGERNRLHLARTLRQSGNLLLLDEPTNDLDVTTLR